MIIQEHLLSLHGSNKTLLKYDYINMNIIFKISYKENSILIIINRIC